MFFAVLAAAQIERNYIREKTLEGQVAAATKSNHGGRPKVIADDSLLFARALEDRGVPVPEIAKKLTIKTGKNAGKNPSVASLYRALAEAGQQEPDDGARVIEQRRPVRARFTGSGSGTDPELMERLTRQVLGGTNDEVLELLAQQLHRRGEPHVIPLPPIRTKGPGVLGAAGPGSCGPFGRWPEPDATADETDGLMSQTLMCAYSEAGPGDGQARTLTTVEDRLTVTWRLLSCPHYAADRVLAGRDH
ncbi:hypothetical protein [Streptomyces adustus]|uniref:hypothetical protein n=1 Tax=Streptomyces adustus TaxID=1609272 RepID=UPI003715BF9A